MGINVDKDGHVYEQKWDGQYRQQQGLFGPKTELDIFGNPKIERDLLGNLKPERNWLGFQRTSSSGERLYRMGGSNLGQWGPLIMLILLVALIIIVVPIWLLWRVAVLPAVGRTIAMAIFVPLGLIAWSLELINHTFDGAGVVALWFTVATLIVVVPRRAKQNS